MKTHDLDPVARKSVLYVEDHSVNVMLMQALVEHFPDLDLVVAVDGREAMSIASDLQPALILLDLRLPDCLGTELLPLLRRLPDCAVTPAVAVTAEPDFDIRGTGFVELWAKPLNVAWVMQRLGALTASSRATAAAHMPTLTDPSLLRSHVSADRGGWAMRL